MDQALIAGLRGPTSVEDGRIEAIRRMKPGQGREAAARELEIVFFTQLVEAMRKTMPEKSMLPKSQGSDVFDGVFDHELAAALVAGDPLGLVATLGRDAGTSPGGSGQRVAAGGGAKLDPLAKSPRGLRPEAGVERGKRGRDGD